MRIIMTNTLVGPPEPMHTLLLAYTWAKQEDAMSQTKGIEIYDITVQAAIDAKEEDLIFYGVYEKVFLSRSNKKYSKYILETTLNRWNNKIKIFSTK